MNALFFGQAGALSWELDGATHILRLTGSGPSPDFPAISERSPRWTLLQEQIREVRVGEGVTRIGSYAFLPRDFGAFSRRRPRLLHVSLPSTLESIGCSAFRGNVRLQRIDLGGCESLEEIGPLAFASCYGATAADLSGCTRLERIGSGAFAGCEGLSYIDLTGCSSLSEESLLSLREESPPHVPIVTPDGSLWLSEGLMQDAGGEPCRVFLGRSPRPAPFTV